MGDNLQNLYQTVEDTIKRYPNQLSQAWQEVNALEIPEEFASAENILLCGMGGSALGGRIIKSYLSDSLPVPFEINTNYTLPSYVDDKSLVIISSYSGTTEETLACFQEAQKRKAGIFIVTTGGSLAELSKENSVPAYVFDPRENPSGQPRLALGYSAGVVLALLTKARFVETVDEDITKVLENMRKVFESQIGDESEAKRLAQNITNKIPILVASDHLLGSAHAVKNQLNESSKTFSALFDIPELNHHLMEGLANPESNKDSLYFIFLESQLYNEKVIRRYPLTREVVEKNKIPFSSVDVGADNKLSQVFEVLVFGSLLSFHLTKIYEINPMEIPWVNYFKERLQNNEVVK